MAIVCYTPMVVIVVAVVIVCVVVVVVVMRGRGWILSEMEGYQPPPTPCTVNHIDRISNGAVILASTIVTIGRAVWPVVMVISSLTFSVVVPVSLWLLITIATT